jgi:hypothetical protein
MGPDYSFRIEQESFAQFTESLQFIPPPVDEVRHGLTGIQMLAHQTATAK